MLAALIFLVAGLVNPNPAMIGAGAARRVSGILKITRHPSFVAFTLFGIAHMMMNGWAGDVLFFGAFPALSVLGGLHQDTPKSDEIGESYRQFELSSFPAPLCSMDASAGGAMTCLSLPSRLAPQRPYCL